MMSLAVLRFYTLIGPTPTNPLGANDYVNATSSICSAFSTDGESWAAEPGVRLAPHDGGAELRVVSPDVLPLDEHGRSFRMYLLRGICTCIHNKSHNLHLILDLNYAYMFPGVGTTRESRKQVCV